MFADYDNTFNLRFQCFLSNLPLGSLIRLSKGKNGFHYKGITHSMIYSQCCAGFRNFRQLRVGFTLLWTKKDGKQASQWIIVTEHVKQILLQSRNPCIAFQEFLEE